MVERHTSSSQRAFVRLGAADRRRRTAEAVPIDEMTEGDLGVSMLSWEGTLTGTSPADGSARSAATHRGRVKGPSHERTVVMVV